MLLVETHTPHAAAPAHIHVTCQPQAGLSDALGLQALLLACMPHAACLPAVVPG